MKATTTNRQPLNITATATDTELYTAAEVATSIALRTLNAKTGLKLYADLITAYHNDRKARAAADIQTAVDNAEEHRNECRKMARAFAAVADRITATEEERAAAEEEAAYWHTQAEAAAEEATDTAAALDGVTFSDRADLTQAAALAIVTTWTEPAEVTEERTAAYAAAIGKTADELTEEEAADLQTAANFRAAINAARTESTKLAHPDAMNRTSTKSRAATAEEVQKWIDTMGGTGKDYRRTAYRKNTKATDCYDTMEYKNTKTAKGWHIIRHYKTIRPYDSYEAAQEASGNEPTADTISTESKAAEALAAIVSRANLTAKERAAVAYYSIATAAEPTEDEKKTAAEVDRAAEAARIAYLASRAAAIAKADSKHQAETIARAKATADRKATAARWEAALAAAGYTNRNSRAKAQAAIIAALQGATESAACIWDLSRNEQPSRPDLIAAISNSTAMIQAAPTVKWRESRILRAAAPCVTGWVEDWAKSAAESAEAIRQAKRHNRIDNSTAEAKARAEAAAKAYAEKHRAAAEAARAEAEAKAEADHKAAVKAAAYRLEVATLDTTYALWCKWTDEQRAAHMEWLNIL